MNTKLSDEKLVNNLEKLLVKAKGKISPADASAALGYPIEQVKDGLSRLIELYESRVSMNKDTGALEFLFAYPFKKRSSKSFNEILFLVLEFLWKVFTVVYKAAIGIILIIYTALFVIILLGLMFGGSRDRDRDNPFGAIIAGAFRAIFEGFRFYAWTRVFEYASDSDGFRYKKYVPEKNKGKNFIQSVYHFVFGPEHPDYDPLSDTKEAIAFIQKNKGKLTAGQIVALTGVDFDEAESRLAKYAAQFKGELYIDSEGIVIAEFPQLLERSNPTLEGGKIEFYIDEIDPPYEMTGNTQGRNVFISAMNLFNLMMSTVIISYFTEGGPATGSPFFENESIAGFILFALGYFPLVFSILFFLIPIIRIPFVNNLKAKRERNVMRKKLVSSFIGKPDEQLDWQYIAKKAGIKNEQEGKAQELMNKLLIELQGELKLDDNGNAKYTFPRLARELLI